MFYIEEILVFAECISVMLLHRFDLKGVIRGGESVMSDSGRFAFIENLHNNQWSILIHTAQLPLNYTMYGVLVFNSKYHCLFQFVRVLFLLLLFF